MAPSVRPGVVAEEYSTAPVTGPPATAPNAAPPAGAPPAAVGRAQLASSRPPETPWMDTLARDTGAVPSLPQSTDLADGRSTPHSECRSDSFHDFPGLFASDRHIPSVVCTTIHGHTGPLAAPEGPPHGA